MPSNWVRYKAKKSFDIVYPSGRRLPISLGQEFYIDLEWPFLEYSQGLDGTYCFVLEQDQFDQISQYLEKVSDTVVSQKDAKDDHAGQIYNPITDTWSWF